MSIILQVMIIGPPDTLFEGGFFKCHLFFPTEYPLKPPVLRWVWNYRVDVGINDVFPRFLTDIYHPNIEKDGKVCISILHDPGDDRWAHAAYFSRMTRMRMCQIFVLLWSPKSSPTKLSLSIILLLQNILPALPGSVRDSLIDDTLLDMGMRKRQRDGCLFTQWRLSSYQSYLC